jgi:hypothetical protein
MTARERVAYLPSLLEHMRDLSVKHDLLEDSTESELVRPAKSSAEPDDGYVVSVRQRPTGSGFIELHSRSAHSATGDTFEGSCTWSLK